VKTLVNLVKLVTVPEGATAIELLVFVVEVDDEVDNAIAFVFEQVVAIAFAGPHCTGLQPGN
jgi:hypothetical protein